MSYDALERGRDLIQTAVNASLSTLVTAVAADHGVSDPGAHRAVYRSFEARPEYPHIEITQPRGRLTALSVGMIETEAEYWVIAGLSAGSPTEVDDACMTYLTALIRLFSAPAFSTGAGLLAEPVEYDFSPPVLESDTTQKRSVGVLVRFTFDEAL